MDQANNNAALIRRSVTSPEESYVGKNDNTDWIAFTVFNQPQDELDISHYCLDWDAIHKELAAVDIMHQSRGTRSDTNERTGEQENDNKFKYGDEKPKGNAHQSESNDNSEGSSIKRDKGKKRVLEDNAEDCSFPKINTTIAMIKITKA